MISSYTVANRILVGLFVTILLTSTIISGISSIPSLEDKSPEQVISAVFSNGTKIEMASAQEEGGAEEQQEAPPEEIQEDPPDEEIEVSDEVTEEVSEVIEEEQQQEPPPNRPPEAGGGTVEVQSGGTVEVSLAASDPDPDEEFSFHIQDQPNNGRLGEFDGNVITYFSNEGFAGTDSFTFTVRDSEGAESNEAEVKIDVIPAPPPPPSEPPAEVVEEEKKPIEEEGEGEQEEPAPPPPVIEEEKKPAPEPLPETPTPTPEPLPEEEQNTPPTVEDQSVETDKGKPITITLGATDVDADNTLSFSIQSGPSHGTVTGEGSSNAVVYTPEADYEGSDSFTFSANDGIEDSSNTGTVTITVHAASTTPTVLEPPTPRRTRPVLELSAIPPFVQHVNVSEPQLCLSAF